MNSPSTSVSRNRLPFLIKVYFIEAFKGLAITLRHLVRNILSPEKKLETIRYPEEQKPVPKGYRGVHRLTARDDGTPRCTACYLCATVCPAKCIYIEAGEREDKSIEKFPVRFEIDELRCVYCGFCEQVCPCDAIRMDSGVVVLSGYNRRDLIFDRDNLMSRGSYDGVPLRTHAQGTQPRRKPARPEKPADGDVKPGGAPS